MYKGYNLEFTPKESSVFERWYETGRKTVVSDKRQIITVIKSFQDSEGALDGTKLKANWFPEITADVFISHSHRDERRAIALAGWLHEKFGIKAFIDSCVWGYADNLLALIDKKYCKTGPETFNYKSRNLSTSHVHMMLSTALCNMIDSTECLFFLNTPQSIVAEEVINKTYSPWIYSEISMTKLIRQRSLEDHRPDMNKSYSADGKLDNLLEEVEFKIKYDVDLDHLISIDANVLNTWADGKRYTFPLDGLYRLAY